MEQTTSDDAIKAKVKELLTGFYRRGVIKTTGSNRSKLPSYGLYNTLSECCGSLVVNKNGAYLSLGKEAQINLQGPNVITYPSTHAFNIKAVADVNEAQARELLKGRFTFGGEKAEIFIPLESGEDKLVIAYKDV